MIPAHFVFAADKKHSGIALLIYLMKMSPKKKKSSFLKLPAKKKTPVKNNKKPGLENIVNMLTSVAVAQLDAVWEKPYQDHCSLRGRRGSYC